MWDTVILNNTKTAGRIVAEEGVPPEKGIRTRMKQLNIVCVFTCVIALLEL